MFEGIREWFGNRTGMEMGLTAGSLFLLWLLWYHFG